MGRGFCFNTAKCFSKIKYGLKILATVLISFLVASCNPWSGSSIVDIPSLTLPSSSPPGGSTGGGGYVPLPSGNLSDLVNYKLSLDGPALSATNIGSDLYLTGSFTKSASNGKLGVLLTPNPTTGKYNVSSLIPDIRGTIFSTAVDSQYNIYLLGLMYVDSNLSVTRSLIKLKPDLTIDNSFPDFHITWPSSWSTLEPASLVVKNNKLYATGIFTDVEGLGRYGAFSVNLENNQITAWNPHFIGGAIIAHETMNSITYIKPSELHGNNNSGYHLLNKQGQSTVLYSSNNQIYIDKSQTKIYESRYSSGSHRLRKLNANFTLDLSFTEINIGSNYMQILILKDRVVVFKENNAYQNSTTKKYFFTVYDHSGNLLYDTPEFTVTTPNIYNLPTMLLETNDQNSIYLADDFPTDFSSFSGSGQNTVRDIPFAEFIFGASSAEITSFYPANLWSDLFTDYGGNPTPSSKRLEKIIFDSNMLTLAHFNQGFYTYNGTTLLPISRIDTNVGYNKILISGTKIIHIGTYYINSAWRSGIVAYDRVTGSMDNAVLDVSNPTVFDFSLPEYVGMVDNTYVANGEVYLYSNGTNKMLVFGLDGTHNIYDMPSNMGSVCNFRFDSASGVCFKGTNYGGVYDAGVYTLNTQNDTLVLPSANFTSGTQSLINSQRKLLAYARNSKYEAVIAQMPNLSYNTRLFVFDVTSNALVYEKFVHVHNKAQMVLSDDILYLANSSVVADPTVFNGSLSPSQCPNYSSSCSVVNNFAAINIPNSQILQDFNRVGSQYSPGPDLNNNWIYYTIFKFKNDVMITRGTQEGFDQNLPEPIYYHAYDADTANPLSFEDDYLKFTPQNDYRYYTHPLQLAAGKVAFIIGTPITYNLVTLSPVIKIPSDTQVPEPLSINAPVLAAENLNDKLLVINQGATLLEGEAVTSPLVVYDPVSGTVTNLNIGALGQMFTSATKAKILRSGNQAFITTDYGALAVTMDSSGQFVVQPYAIIAGNNTSLISFALGADQIFMVGSIDELAITDLNMQNPVMSHLSSSTFVKAKNVNTLFSTGVGQFESVNGITLDPMMGNLSSMGADPASLEIVSGSVIIAGVSHVGVTPSSLAKYNIINEAFDTSFIHTASLTFSNMTIPNLITNIIKIDDDHLLMNGLIDTFDSQTLSTYAPILKISDGSLQTSSMSLYSLVGVGKIFKIPSGNYIKTSILGGNAFEIEVY